MYIPTYGLLDQIGPVGGFGENFDTSKIEPVLERIWASLYIFSSSKVCAFKIH